MGLGSSAAGFYPALRGLGAVRFELFDEEGAGAADAAFHRAGGAVAEGGGFLVGETLAEDEADGVGHVGRQAGDLREEVGAFGGVFGRALVDKQVADRLVAHLRQAAVAAQALQPLIAQYTEDPRAERAGRVIAGKGAEGAHAGILHAVVGHVRIAGEVAGIGAQGGQAASDEFGEEIFPGALMRGGEARDGVCGAILRGAQRAGHVGVTKWLG